MNFRELIVFVLFIFLIFFLGIYWRIYSQNMYLADFENNLHMVQTALALTRAVDMEAYEKIRISSKEKNEGVSVEQIFKGDYIEKSLSKEEIDLLLQLEQSLQELWDGFYQVISCQEGELVLVSSGPNKVLGDHDDVVGKLGLPCDINQE